MGADYRGLGIVRSLGRRGIPVWVLKQNDHVLAATSRYAYRTAAWPAGNQQQRAQFLLELAQQHGLRAWVLFPTDDEAVELVARHYAMLAEQYLLTVPPWGLTQWLCNKRLMHRLAQALEVDQPWTFCPRTREDLLATAFPFPVIVKPALRESANPLTLAKAWRADDRNALLALFEEACRFVPPDMLMVQEVVPGGGKEQFSYAALCQDGQLLASVVAKRLRQFPMDFGRASTFVETIPDPGLAEPALRLLRAIQFTGMAEVEFKRDPRNGRYKLLDVNPRVWGWQSVCGRAGVDFPYLLWLLLHKQPVPAAQGTPDVRWARLATDVPIVVWEILRGQLSMRDYLQSLRPPREPAIFAADDVLPGLLELPLLAYMMAKRVLRLPLQPARQEPSNRAQADRAMTARGSGSQPSRPLA